MDVGVPSECLGLCKNKNSTDNIARFDNVCNLHIERIHTCMNYEHTTPESSKFKIMSQRNVHTYFMQRCVKYDYSYKISVFSTVTTQPPPKGALIAGLIVLTIGMVLAAAGFYALRLSKTKQIDPGII